MTARILVSACLLGAPVRYDGRPKTLVCATVDRWRAEGRVIAVCPELLGGLATPRPPAEIAAGRDGADVLAGRGRVATAGGGDVTAAFLAGAEAALALARDHGCAFALLTDGSPSCGRLAIHAGRFDGARRPGMGVTAALLEREGVAVYAESAVAALDARLRAAG